MRLTAKELKIVNKYLPEDKINDILNYQKIINYVCENCNIDEKTIASNRQDERVTNARLLLVALTIKIFQPKYYEQNIILTKRKRLINGTSEMISKTINKSIKTTGYYFNKFKDYLTTNQIDHKMIDKMEIEILKTFEYKR
jgi:hypothetical protein